MLGSRGAGVTEESSWSQVTAGIGAPRGIARLRQVHGHRIVVPEAGTDGIPEGDILITQQAGLAIAVQAADCVPLLFVDPAKAVVAAAHAGWRGMAADVPRRTVAALGSRFGCRPENLLVAAGPSIGACCYEVGPEVRRAFATPEWTSAGIDNCFHHFHDAAVPTVRNPAMLQRGPTPGRWFFDGWACVRRQLEAAGVPTDQIHGAGLCTASHPDAFPSYRRDGSRAGRIAGAIRLP
jgi:YfiH family protein